MSLIFRESFCFVHIASVRKIKWLFHFLRILHANVSLWSFTGLWETASLIRSVAFLFFKKRKKKKGSVLYGLDLSFDVQCLQSLLQTLRNLFKSTNNNLHHRHPHDLTIFCSLARFKYLSLFSVIIIIYSFSSFSHQR